MARAKYEVLSVGITDGMAVILLADLNGPVSITNDAEKVVEEVIKWRNDNFSKDGPFKIHYIDSDGIRSELMHDGGKFINFKDL